MGDEFSSEDHVLVGHPSMAALRLMGKAYGFKLEALSDWQALLRDNPDAKCIGDYRKGKRVTALFCRQAVVKPNPGQIDALTRPHLMGF